MISRMMIWTRASSSNKTLYTKSNIRPLDHIICGY